MGEFSCASESPVSFAARSAAEVVAYLAIHRNRWVPREELAETIWPGTDQKVARTNLRKATQRVRESLSPHDVLLKYSENLAINRQLVESDLDRAEALHRQYAFAPHLTESVEKLWAEWQILDHTLLDGWDNDWVVEERKNFAIRSHELGLRLADALESVGKIEECLGVLNTLIVRSPLDYELLQKTIRLQSRTGSGYNASKLVEQLLSDLPPQTEIPKPVRRLIQRVQQGQIEQVPAPELFETKNELALLARMVESNIRSNSPEAMALLAKESSNIDNWAHAKTLLSILTVALEHSEVKSDDEILIATNACFLATYASDFHVGQWAAKRVLDVLPESDERYIRVLSVLGFLHFETKNYDEARRLLNEAVDLCRKYKVDAELPRVLNRLAVLDYHLGNFEVAHAMFLEAIDLETKNNEPNRDSRLASFHGNLCTMEVLRCRWESARHHGELAFRYAEHSAKVYQIYVSAGYGLALLKTGDRRGIDFIIDGIVQTTRERMRRFNMISVDFGVAALADQKAFEPAAQIAYLNRLIREASGYPRGPAEMGFIKASFEPAGKISVPKMQPMSLVALSRWAVEELEALK
ncbi:MAG: tetratricopeptide repeat protein [Armatimonadetes bacterium]|nr:tetratricopeptide repeat protein [Armatimonadota bacterium]